MLFQGITICCPTCRGPIEAAEQSEVCCTDCHRRFPILAGIPDLRVFADPYIDLESDRAKATLLAQRLEDLSFTELLEYYYSITPAVPPQQAREYTRGLLVAEERAETALESWLRQSSDYGSPSSRSLLDLGCGTAPLTVVARSRYQLVVGTDIALRWLVVAKKRLEEKDIEVPLICACAEALPFPDRIFDCVAGESVLENVRDQAQALREAHRVARPGGYLFLSTPNRFSLGPDPQTGLWASGWMPKRWIDLYVRRQGGIPPKRNLLSPGTLKDMIGTAGFSAPVISVPRVSPAQRNQRGFLLRLLIDAFHLLRRLPVARNVLLAIGPLLQVVAQRPSEQADSG